MPIVCAHDVGRMRRDLNSQNLMCEVCNHTVSDIELHELYRLVMTESGASRTEARNQSLSMYVRGPREENVQATAAFIKSLGLKII